MRRRKASAELRGFWTGRGGASLQGGLPAGNTGGLVHKKGQNKIGVHGVRNLENAVGGGPIGGGNRC